VIRTASIVVAILAALALAAVAQDKPAAPPVLSELTATKIENVYLRLAAIQRLQADALADLQRLIVRVEADHPGWTWDVQAQRIAPKPKAVEAKK
jgi:hypothetical protein